MAAVPTQKYTGLIPGVDAVLVNAATTTGAGSSFWFTVSPTPFGGRRTVTLTATGTFSVCTVTVTSSQDGGTTVNSPYSSADTAIDIHAQNPIVLTDLTPGLIYRLNLASFTGTSITITGTEA
jgi:hypothetical protein